LHQRVQQLLQRIHTVQPEAHVASGSSDAPLRYVHWNILHGNEGPSVLEALQTDPALCNADLISLNEVDIGMRRSGNLDVCRTLARQLGMHAVWCALFLELHGGLTRSQRGVAGATDTVVDPDDASADDREALFGLCLLSRYPLSQPRRLILETPEDLLFDREGKVGNFVALSVEVQHPVRSFRVIVTHLDVHGTPALRQRQLQEILDATPPGPTILSGDFNSTTLARGNLGRTIGAFALLALSPQQKLRRRLQQPDKPTAAPREPLFRALHNHGFQWQESNDGQETLDLLLKDVQEAQELPKVVRALARPLLGHVERRTKHRLDWITARDLPCLQHSAQTRLQWMRGARPASDHAPIVCSFNVSEPQRP
jgi:endonuclease/exonuclease/phosphatase family metal-dependent hydrolase